MTMLKELKSKKEGSMHRVNQICRHPAYLKNLEKNMLAETKRIFCHHDMQHFLDVARLAYILSLEKQYSLSQELIYAAALLHDIGKWEQYENGTPHERSSAKLAGAILKDCDFDHEEIDSILRAISNHRREQELFDPLSQVLFLADKLSRACFSCPASSNCNWDEEKKNLDILL